MSLRLGQELAPPAAGLLAADSFVPVPSALTLPQVALADDLTLVSSSTVSLYGLSSVVGSLVSIHDIELNARKTVLAKKSIMHLQAPSIIGGAAVGTVLEHGEPLRVLGDWISTHCLRSQQVAMLLIA